jgi:WD40 repeat protein
MRWANRRTLRCLSRRSLDAAIASLLRSTAPLLQADSKSAPAPELIKSTFSRHWIAIALFSSIVMGVLVWVAWRYPSRRADVIERKLTANSPESSVSSAAVSPDGKYLAYADNTGIYLKQIRTGETHPVPLPPNFSARVDDWFPDGSHLLVSRAEQPLRTSLWSVSPFGGSRRQLADDASRGSLSPDGTHIAFCRVHLTAGVPKEFVPA